MPLGVSALVTRLRKSLISTISVTGWAWIPSLPGVSALSPWRLQRRAASRKRSPGATLDKIAELLHDIASKKGIGPSWQKEFAICENMGDGRRGHSREGLDPAGYDPRVLKGMGLACATSDRGACHLRQLSIRLSWPG